MRPLELSDENAPSLRRRFFYRQSARGAGMGMMIGPPVLAVGVTALAWFFCEAFFRDAPTALMWSTFLCISGFFALVAIAFFVLGLRRVIYGGEWGCYVDDQHMTCVYPHRMGKQDQQIAVTDIRRFVVKVDHRRGDDTRYSYFIETPSGSYPIDIECFGRIRRLGRALLQVNPAIRLEILENGESRPWAPDQAPWWLR